MILGWIIPGWLKRGALALAGLALALLAAFGTGRREGRLSAKAKAAEDAAKRSEKGREAAAKAKDRLKAGESPEDVARRNDGDWQ